ncbi:hypothetical protein PCANC_19767 [Puccinia coronata f. sp. avenae]|uniref:BHLH domain-containing protein n=1 Tax=Puccinia coronata f. sp. avenae TaxID=200324 RepID=A0A2N5UB90_9BASI|nr:hypothetical protein PCANC_19767 [Puccinia coronata f. sp. avenae]
MSNGTAQFTNHACLSSEQHPFMRSSSLHPPPSHTTEELHHPPLRRAPNDYQNYHHQHPSLGLNHHHQPHSLRLETFDPGFQLPSTQGLGLLPMPVAYEDFQYALPPLETPDQAAHNNSSGAGSSNLQAGNTDSVYPTYRHSSASYRPDYHISLPNGWDASPASRQQLASPNMNHDLILNNFLNDSASNPQPQSSASIRPVAPPSAAPIESSSGNPAQYNFDHYFHEPAGIPSQAALINYAPPNPPTPPPLFDASEQDLLSSFLNILGDPNGECDFDPQGMPEGMPVLGELKRRLEECGHDRPVEYSGKRETDEMGRQVERRLKISEPEHSHLRRPSLQSFQTTSGSLSSSSDSHLYQEPEALSSRKKVKTSNTPTNHLESIHPFHIPEVLHHGGHELESDVEMRHWNRNSRCETGGWPDQLLPGVDPQRPQSTHEHHLVKSSEPAQYPSLSPVFQNDGSPSQPDKGTLDDPSGDNTDRGQEDQSSVQPAPKRTSKPGKNTHIVSEQRRRNAIQGGFGSLVEILRTGEAQSGISIATPDLPSHPSGQGGSSTSHNKKPKTRGRGRRGEIETGASKSVVLERAAEFVQWMADGNCALIKEIQRVESILQSYGIQV